MLSGLRPMMPIALALLLLASGSARSDDLPPIDDYADDGFGMDLSAYGYFNFGYHKFGHGAGAQFAYPVLPLGFIRNPRYRDALHVEGGLDFYRWSWDQQDASVSLAIFAPQVGARYAVYVTNNLAPFGCVKLGVGLAVADGVDDSAFFFWSASAGVLYDLNGWLSLRGEFGWGRFWDVFRLGVLFRL